MQDRTYSDLFTLIRSLAGAGTLTPQEQPSIESFVNRRANEAYNTSQSWPRYLVIGEPRSVIPDQTVPYAEDSYYIYGAGVEAVNGLYIKSDTQFNSHDVWYKDMGDYLYVIRRETHDAHNTWHLIKATAVDVAEGAADEYLYSDGHTGSGPTDSFVVDDDGVAPAPKLVDVANIHEFIRIHRQRPMLRNSTIEYDFYVDNIGAHILNPVTTDASVAYVTYKKELPQFTDTSTDIPGEWFSFLAHSAYADYLRMDQKYQEAIAEEQIAQKYLSMELEKVDNMMNNNTALKRFSTYTNRQAR